MSHELAIDGATANDVACCNLKDSTIKELWNCCTESIVEETPAGSVRSCWYRFVLRNTSTTSKEVHWKQQSVLRTLKEKTVFKT